MQQAGYYTVTGHSAAKGRKSTNLYCLLIFECIKLLVGH